MPIRNFMLEGTLTDMESGEVVTITGEVEAYADPPPAVIDPPPVIIDPPPPIESGIGLTYVRTIGLPSLYMGFASGDCTGRVVDGQTRLLFTGDEVNQNCPIYEVEITEAPVATYINAWTDPYGGKRGTWVSGATALLASAEALEVEGAKLKNAKMLELAAHRRKQAKKAPKSEPYWIDFFDQPTPAFNSGHYYHAGHDLLYVSYGDIYNVSGRPDWHVVAMKLLPDGTTEAYGPWRFEATNGDGVTSYGPRAVGNFRPDPTDGTILACTSLTAGNASCPWGCNLVGGAPWMTSQTPVGPDVPNIRLPDHYLYGYYIGPEINTQTGVCNGPVRAQRRRLDPYVYEIPHEGAQANCVNPAAYQGVGSWTDLDAVCGLLPLTDRVYFFGGVAGAVSQDPTDPKAGHMFYANEHNHFTCNHGFAAVPAGITGPCTTGRYPFACWYGRDVLDQVKQHLAVDWAVEPSAFSNLETEFGIVTSPIETVGNAKAICGGFFREDTRDLYLIAHAADQGTTTFGQVTAFIHQFKVA